MPEQYIGRRKPTVVVSAFIEKDDKFLIIKEEKFDFWRVPGGRVEWGEDIEEALKREIKEELGIDIQITKNLGFGQDKVRLLNKDKEASRILLFFHCKIKSGKVKLLEEGIKEYRWATMDDIKEMDDFEPAVNDYIGRFE